MYLKIKKIKKLCLIALLVTTVFLLGLLKISYSQDRRNNKSSLVVATLNVEFLWDGVEPEEGRVLFPHKNSQTEAEEHMKKIAEIIISANPDIINLVEVENFEALMTFNNKFLSGRGYKPYLIKGKDTFTGQDVAILTRIDPIEEKIFRFNEKGQSGNIQYAVSKNYYTKFNINNLKIALIGIHFLARPNDTSRKFKREAQADAIVTLAKNLQDQEFLLIILGDFNDYDGDPSSIDHLDNMPITDVLSSLKTMNTEDEEDDLTNCSRHVPKINRYTAFWDKNRNGQVNPPDEFSSIDHVLVSKDLALYIEFVDIPHNHNPLIVTDHFPVVVKFKLSDTEYSGETKIRMIALVPNPEGDENQNESIVNIQPNLDRLV